MTEATNIVNGFTCPTSPEGVKTNCVCNWIELARSFALFGKQVPDD
jgi:hypothetical protein